MSSSWIPILETICSQPLRIGDCTENVKRYWYNAKTRQCQMFEFSGCQGNDNNFETVLDCQSFCKNAIRKCFRLAWIVGFVVTVSSLI